MYPALPSILQPCLVCTHPVLIMNTCWFMPRPIRRQDAAHSRFMNETGTLHLETLLQANPGSGWVRNENQVDRGAGATQLQHQGPQ